MPTVAEEAVRDLCRGRRTEAEVQAYIAARAELLDERGRRLVVRNGHVRRATRALFQVVDRRNQAGNVLPRQRFP